jgi:hypothetical protein
LHPFTASGRARILRYGEAGVYVEANLSDDEWRGLQHVGAELNDGASVRDEGL